MNTSRLTPMGRRIYVGMLSTGIDSAAELARRSQTSRPTTHRLLYHQSDHVDAGTLLRVSDAVCLSMRWLLHGTGMPNKPAQVTPNAARLVAVFASLTRERRSILIHCANELADL